MSVLGKSIKSNTLLQIIKLIRPHHSIKNLLLFLPLIFSGRLFEMSLAIKVLFGFFAFSLVSGAVYVINDIKDVQRDRAHPVKCKRPIASGAVSVRTGIFAAAVCLLFALLFNYLSCAAPLATGLLGLYFVLNIAYSLGLKEIPLADIVILASGFLLRVTYGSAITQIPVSQWMYLTVISVSFFLGLGKRRGEKTGSGNEKRKVLKYYSYGFLDKNMYISNALFLIFYALWCTSDDISKGFGGKMVLTVPLVMLISMKYSLNVESECDGDPVEVLLSDRLLLLLSLIYGISVLIIIYGTAA